MFHIPVRDIKLSNSFCSVVNIKTKQLFFRQHCQVIPELSKNFTKKVSWNAEEEKENHFCICHDGIAYNYVIY